MSWFRLSSYFFNMMQSTSAGPPAEPAPAEPSPAEPARLAKVSAAVSDRRARFHLAGAARAHRIATIEADASRDDERCGGRQSSRDVRPKMRLETRPSLPGPICGRANERTIEPWRTPPSSVGWGSLPSSQRHAPIGSPGSRRMRGRGAVITKPAVCWSRYGVTPNSVA
jgi:hypothetical protein